MGTPKALLEWHGSTLARRVVGIVRRAVDGPVVVVRARGQVLPPLPDDVTIVDDDRDGRGPLQGIATGLAAVGAQADAAFVSSVDVPFLSPAFVRHIAAALVAGIDIVVPHLGGHRHPLAACYRTSVAPTVDALLAEGLAKPAFLFERCSTLWLDDDAVRAVDPLFASVRNINEPADYADARSEPAPIVRVERYGILRPEGQRDGVEIAAATLGGAARAIGIEINGHVIAAVNGDQITRDPEWPLVSGDTVAFLVADAGG
jgi:molybdenum cofactor guanylyltransferase